MMPGCLYPARADPTPGFRSGPALWTVALLTAGGVLRICDAALGVSGVSGALTLLGRFAVGRGTAAELHLLYAPRDCWAVWGADVAVPLPSDCIFGVLLPGVVVL